MSSVARDRRLITLSPECSLERPCSHLQTRGPLLLEGVEHTDTARFPRSGWLKQRADQAC